MCFISPTSNSCSFLFDMVLLFLFSLLLMQVSFLESTIQQRAVSWRLGTAHADVPAASVLTGHTLDEAELEPLMPCIKCVDTIGRNPYGVSSGAADVLFEMVHCSGSSPFLHSAVCAVCFVNHGWLCLPR